MKLLVSLLLLLCAGTVAAQPGDLAQRDSLFRELAAAKADTDKARVLFSISGYFGGQQQFDSALVYMRRSGELSEKIGYSNGMYHYYLSCAPIFGNLRRLDECIAISHKALDLSRKLNRPEGVSNAYFNIASAYKGQGRFQDALDYYLRADTVVRAMHDTTRLCSNLSQMAMLYLYLDLPARSYQCGLQVLDLSSKAHLEEQYYNGLIHTADALKALQRSDSSLLLYQQAAAMARQHSDYYNLTTILANMALLLVDMGVYERLLAVADSEITLSEMIHRPETICEGNVGKGKYYLFRRQYALADTYATRALAIAERLNAFQNLGNCYNLLADVKLVLGDYSGHIRYQKRSDSLRDALVSDKVLKSTQELDTRYKVAQKDHELLMQGVELQRNRLQMGILIVVLLFTAIVALLVSRSQRSKRRLLITEQKLQQQKIQALETERQLLATQSVVQGQEEERSRIARELHDGLGGILSGAKYSLSNMKENLIITPENATAFEKTMSMLDLSINEMRRMAHNMMPESLMKLSLNEALQDYCDQVNANGVLAISYQSSGLDGLTITDTQKITVYRIVQELINNAAKHSGSELVIVQVFSKEGMLYLDVEDNGKGFDKTQLLFSSGIGFRNIKSRIDYLNGKLTIDSAPQKGTSVYIEIPMQ